MAPFQLQSLGALRLIGPDGEALRGRRKPLVLLVYLARQSARPISRERLAELLWGGRAERRARQSLRQALYRLRSVLGDHLEIDAARVRLPESAIELDANVFERHVADGRLAAAVDAWAGEFLDGMDDLGGGTYRTWVDVERQGLRRKLGWSLERLVDESERRRDWEEAARWAERWSDAFPLEEAAAERLVRALAASERVPEALSRHGAFATRLAVELDETPSHGFEELAAELAREPAGGAGPGSSALLAPDLVGRDTALAALDAAWSEARKAGAVVLVEGSEGMGRTRLCREFLQRVRASGEAFVLGVEATDADGERPWATAGRLLAGLRHAPGLLGAPDRALAELAGVVPSLHERFPGLPDPADSTRSAEGEPSAGGEPSTADTADTADAGALPAVPAGALARVLEDVAAEAPVVILVDDLERADPATRRLVGELALRIPPGVLLVASVRTHEVGPDEGIRALQAAPRLHRLKLQPLTEDELEVLLDSMLPLSGADRRALASRLHAETGGNPLYTVELASALADIGLLVPGPTGVWRADAGLEAGIPLPPGVRAAVLTRVEHLSPAARRLVDAAAVLGHHLDTDVLHEVAGLSERDYTTALDELLARRILRPPESPGAEYWFGQGLIRRVVADALPGPRRRALHRTALRALARRGVGEERLRRHREGARMALPGLRTWQWRHPRVALAVIFAIVLATGALALTLARPPAPAGTDVVAVFPFTVQGGEELGYSGQAVASLLATSLDGAPSLRSVDPLRLPSAAVPELEARIEIGAARGLARRLGAGLFVLGTVIESQGRLRATASLYDAAGQRRALALATVGGDDLFGLADALARDLLSDMQRGSSGQMARVAASTTPSLEAFKDYLGGEVALRAGHYDEAIDAFRAALDRDSAFALASYRMSVAAEWREDGETASDALAHALRHRTRLPDRYGMLAAADSARQAGAARDAERRYREVVARHPDEALAWYYLGEVLIHFNPMRGRPLAESQHAFERTLQLDPDNYEARWHLAQLAASAADTAALVRWADPLLAGGDRDRVAWSAVRDVLRGDREAIRRNRDSIRGSGGDVAYSGAWLVPLLAGDMVEGARLARAVSRTDPVREWRTGAHVLAAHAEMARGRREAALRELEEAAALDTGTALLYRALFAILPGPGASIPELAEVRDELTGWDAAARTPTPIPHPFLALHDGAHEHLRLYLLGLIQARLGEGAAAMDAAEGLGRLGSAPHDDAFGSDLARAVEAEVARAAGRDQRALSLLEEMRMRPSYVAVSFSPFHSFARDRFARGTLLQALGRDSEADLWLASVAESPPFGYVFLGPSLLRRAELHERRGDAETAAHLYQRLVRLWADADAAYQPLVDHARRRLTQLGGGASSGG